mmetsp:Transcript_118078/g.378453  ORF Transcript_118078/g.378453 Transcript_118078/m.378453 type:complete len:369 (+) Transcript_118078:336-1442(+)
MGQSAGCLVDCGCEHTHARVEGEVQHQLDELHVQQDVRDDTEVQEEIRAALDVLQGGKELLHHLCELGFRIAGVAQHLVKQAGVQLGHGVLLEPHRQKHRTIDDQGHPGKHLKRDHTIPARSALVQLIYRMPDAQRAEENHTDHEACERNPGGFDQISVAQDRLRCSHLAGRINFESDAHGREQLLDLRVHKGAHCNISRLDIQPLHCTHGFDVFLSLPQHLRVDRRIKVCGPAGEAEDTLLTSRRIFDAQALRATRIIGKLLGMRCRPVDASDDVALPLAVQGRRLHEKTIVTLVEEQLREATALPLCYTSLVHDGWQHRELGPDKLLHRLVSKGAAHATRTRARSNGKAVVTDRGSIVLTSQGAIA